MEIRLLKENEKIRAAEIAVISFHQRVEDLEKASHSRTPVAEVWARAAAAAEEAAAATKDLLPKVGRARPQAERSLGTPDAGATSLAMCLKAVLPGEEAAAGETP